MSLDTTAEQLRRLLQWQAGENPPPGPTKLVLFPTNICNLRCIHCWQRWADYDKTYETELSDERLLHLVDEAAAIGVQEWYFVGGGDPMGRSKLIMKMCRRIREHGMNGTLHTNGTLFKPEMLEQLVDTQWHEVCVSLDGPNQEINDYIRTKGFEKAIGAVRRLSELKRAKNVESPKLDLHVAVTKLTYNKITDFVELAHSLGPDVSVQLNGLIVQGEASAELDLTTEQKDAYPGHVREGLERARVLGVSNNFEFYLDKEIILDGMDMHRDYTHVMSGGLVPSMCYEPWSSLSMLPDGSVGPCCAWSDDAALSIKDHTLAEVWNGAYMNKVREGMLTGHPPEYCRRCPSSLYAFKERRRKLFKRQLTEQLAMASMSAPGRAKYLVARSVSSIREMGIKKTVARGVAWARIRRGIKKTSVNS